MDPFATDIDPVSCLVKTGGRALDLRMLGLSVSRETGRIPTALLELLDGGPAEGGFGESDRRRLDPGQELEIQIGRKGEEQTVFKGMVTRQSIEARGNGSFRLLLECRDRAYRMCLDRRVRFHHSTVNDPPKEPRDQDVVPDVTDDAVLAELLKLPEYGLELQNKARLSEREEAVFRHENLLQYHASDWDFMLMRIEATGRLCTVEDGTVVIFAPDLSGEKATSLELGVDLLEFEAEFDGTVGHGSVEVTSWDIDQLRTRHQDERPLEPAGPGQMSISELGRDAGMEERTLLHGGDLKDNEARLWAKHRADRLALAKLRGVARIPGRHGMRIGELVRLKGLGGHWDGKAMISGVRHEFRDGRWDSFLQLGLSDQPHGEKFPVHPAPGANLLPGVPGLLFGIVRGYAKSPGGYELIKVEISAPGDEQAPHVVYARQASVYAGNKGGAHFRPEPDDEVVLGFIQQDPRFPVILGSLYSNQLPAPWPPENGKQDKRGFALTGAEGKEWQICIDESGNSLTVAGKDQKITLDDQNNAIRLEDGNDNSIVMDSNGITLESKKGSIVLKAEKSVESSVGQSSSTVGKTSVQIKAAMLDLSADNLAQLKGSILDLN